MITAEQLTALKAKVDVLVEDKLQADIATEKSNEADAVAVKAAADAASAKLVEQSADATVAADLGDLTSFVDSLSPPLPAILP